MTATPSFWRFIDYLVYILVRAIEEIINVIPEKTALSLGRFFGRVVYVLFRDRRAAVLENLTIAFGKEKPRCWIVRVARRNFEHLGMSAIEFFRIRRWREDELADRLLIDGSRSYNLVMSPGNHGVVILNSHFGTFELGAALAKLLGWKVHLIVTPLKNPFLSRYFFSRGGKGTGIMTYPHKGVVKDLIRFLQSGEMVAFLADQRGDAERGIFVDYFGTRAPANEVFAKMAIEGGPHVLPLATYRREDGRYQVVFSEEIVIEPTGDVTTDLTTVSQQFHDQFERWVRLAPVQGFWVQRKWRRKRRSRRRKKPARVSA
jgi:KDO2-lipid IV(A) lauroyltransferase